ncbi:glycosyltransferase family 4 protein [Streptomyces sp. NPDC088090]|uniref:glycosyltransferase family 4 protein n=1 Tax=Streptomyces sp. NPDC088090 TaxID=3365822 RepID=UPI00384B4787
MTAGNLSQLARADVLLLNRRDPWHPEAGGAEAYCFELARRFAASGAEVTLFTARYPGSAPASTADGVRILRAGGVYGVYPAAAGHLLRHRHAYDAVVDFQDGIPFFSPLFAGRGTAAVRVIHHLHRQRFDDRFRWPLGALVRRLEQRVGRAAYRGRPVVVPSPSTREATRRDLRLANPVYVVPSGSPALPGRPAAPRACTPTLAVVSRLVPHKRVELLVRAVPALLLRYPDLRVHVCGDGAERGRLRALAAGTGAAGAVTFHGRVDERRRQELLAQAWLAVVPFPAEGRGLTVIEANAAGTPTVARDVPGLRDAVQHRRNGWLLTSDADLAEGIAEALEELTDPVVRERFAAGCRAWAARFSWDSSAERLAAVVLQEGRRLRRHRRSRRRPNDLTAAGRFRAADGDAMERSIRRVLRQTDDYARRGDEFRLLLHDCDEVRAVRALRRLGVHDGSVTLASRRDVLLGTGREPAP